MYFNTELLKNGWVCQAKAPTERTKKVVTAVTHLEADAVKLEAEGLAAFKAMCKKPGAFSTMQFNPRIENALTLLSNMYDQKDFAQKNNMQIEHVVLKRRDVYAHEEKDGHLPFSARVFMAKKPTAYRLVFLNTLSSYAQAGMLMVMATNNAKIFTLEAEGKKKLVEAAQLSVSNSPDLHLFRIPFEGGAPVKPIILESPVGRTELTFELRPTFDK